MNPKHWLLAPLQCFLFGSLVDSSSVTSSVGHQAVLPCSWKLRLHDEAPPTCHLQWVSTSNTVLEQDGEQRFESEEFRGRLEVRAQRLMAGDCSLTISDVQLSDSGTYSSFMVVHGERTHPTRVFIQTVRLSVQDHKARLARPPGGAVVLQLHTQSSVRLVFQARNSSDWTVLWMRGDPASARLEKDPHLEQVVLTHLRASDQGTYKVLDPQGLSVSTVQLSVEEPSTHSFHRMQEHTPTAFALGLSSSALLVLSALVSSELLWF